MHDDDKFLKSTEYFRNKMTERKDYMGMHLPRIFANKADDLFGDLFFPLRQKTGEEHEESEKRS